jgi:hypothetical protein
MRSLFEFELITVTGGQSRRAVPRILGGTGTNNPPPEDPNNPFEFSDSDKRALTIGVIGAFIVDGIKGTYSSVQNQAVYYADRLYNYTIGLTDDAQSVLDARDGVLRELRREAESASGGGDEDSAEVSAFFDYWEDWSGFDERHRASRHIPNYMCEA